MRQVISCSNHENTALVIGWCFFPSDYYTTFVMCRLHYSLIDLKDLITSILFSLGLFIQTVQYARLFVFHLQYVKQQCIGI